jgi:group I intron endonuclease
VEIYGRIYLLTSPSGKCYIGQTVNDFDKYFQNNYVNKKGGVRKLINRAILKYGIENFKVEIVAECYSKDDLDRAEIAFIKTFDSANTGYNIKLGGSNGRPGPNSKLFSEEYSLSQSLSIKGRIVSEETRLKKSLIIKNDPEKMKQITELGKSKLGNVISDEMKKRISDKLKGNKIALGTHWPEESKIAFSKKKETHSYIIEDPNGNRYNSTNLRSFCREYDLYQGNLIKGFDRGWSLISKTNKNGETVLVRDTKKTFKKESV